MVSLRDGGGRATWPPPMLTPGRRRDLDPSQDVERLPPEVRATVIEDRMAPCSISGYPLLAYGIGDEFPRRRVSASD